MKKLGGQRVTRMFVGMGSPVYLMSVVRKANQELKNNS